MRLTDRVVMSTEINIRTPPHHSGGQRCPRMLGFFPTLNALQEKLLGVIVFFFGTGLLGKNKVLGLAQTCQD